MEYSAPYCMGNSALLHGIFGPLQINKIFSRFRRLSKNKNLGRSSCTRMIVQAKLFQKMYEDYLFTPNFNKLCK